ncbi:MAG: hypothetical protein KU29_13475 [Sulfurovum sp. FS06-10]|jgi:mRNA interferase YafQ|nr:MAG: hypothetical protein KU29_13475 [Sulfurovum sp. FS06-10]
MLEVKIEKSFKKDIQRDKKCGQYSQKEFEILKTIISQLQNEEEIDIGFKRHPLKGDMKDTECIHLKGDWLLIFKIDENYLNLIMLGKHTQVYRKFK